MAARREMSRHPDKIFALTDKNILRLRSVKTQLIYCQL